MRMLDPKWLEEHLQANPEVLSVEEVDNRILITASTKELQEFVIRHLKTESAFGDALKKKRVK